MLPNKSHCCFSNVGLCSIIERVLLGKRYPNLYPNKPNNGIPLMIVNLVDYVPDHLVAHFATCNSPKVLSGYVQSATNCAAKCLTSTVIFALSWHPNEKGEYKCYCYPDEKSRTCNNKGFDKDLSLYRTGKLFHSKQYSFFYAFHISLLFDSVFAKYNVYIPFVKPVEFSIIVLTRSIG